MSRHVAFRRQPVDGQVAQRLNAMTIPAPLRGLALSENYAFMQPGGAVVLDNWVPTLRGVKLRGGFIRWCDLHPGLAVPHVDRRPIVSAFEYADHLIHRMFAANANGLYEVTTNTAVQVVGAIGSPNYSAAQLSNAAGNWMIAVNDAGDAPLQLDGTTNTWTQLDSGEITGAVGTPVAAGLNLVHVWKYRNRLFFIERNSMNAWYLGLNAVQGALNLIPLSGAATKGGKLLSGATWSVDAGDGIDDKCVFLTDLGEVLIFTGSDPGSATNWRQEGRYAVGKPLGKNAHISLGGDLLIATTDGLVPISAAITKTAERLELAMLSHNIRSMWRAEAIDKRDFPWSMKRWDEYGGMFVTWPGGQAGNRRCAVINTGTGAWARLPGIDALCFIRMREDLFFGTQDGIVMQAERTGYEDGIPYLASLVGGWSTFQQQASTAVWHQARASFQSPNAQPFIPQLSACTDFVVTLPPPPLVGLDAGVADVWDQGKWDDAKWDQATLTIPPVRNTRWVSIGRTGYSLAPVVQIMVGQQARPDVELLTIDATFERAGVNV